MDDSDLRDILERESMRLRKEIGKLEVLKIVEEDPTLLAKHIVKLEKFKKQYSKLLAVIQTLPIVEDIDSILARMP